MLHAVIQHVAQKADTVVAKLVGPIVIQRPDTVYSISITPPTTAESWTAYSTVAVAFLALVAIGVEVWRDIRRSGEVKREEASRRTAIDARISAVAYALRRQIKSWLREAPEVTLALVDIVDNWRDVTKTLGAEDTAGDVPGITEGMVAATLRWYGERAGVQFDRAEARLVQIVTDAPGASARVKDAVNKAFVVFYRATERINRQTVLYEHGDTNVQELASAYHELNECVALLLPAIGDELKAIKTGETDDAHEKTTPPDKQKTVTTPTTNAHTTTPPTKNAP